MTFCKVESCGWNFEGICTSYEILLEVSDKKTGTLECQKYKRKENEAQCKRNDADTAEAV